MKIRIKNLNIFVTLYVTCCNFLCALCLDVNSLWKITVNLQSKLFNVKYKLCNIFCNTGYS